MKFATEKDFQEIYAIIRLYGAVFPHIRSDYIKRMIKAKKCIFENGVVIIFNKYSRRQKIGLGHQTKKGDWIIKQIANRETGNGQAKQVFKKFVEFIDNDLWLTVRSANARAIKFYFKMGMHFVDATSWANGSIKGSVYKYEKRRIHERTLDEISDR